VTNQEEKHLTEAIRRSDVGLHFLYVGGSEDDASAHFRSATGERFSVSSEWMVDSNVESTAAELISKARVKLLSSFA
jgi:hypothetical protein